MPSQKTMTSPSALTKEEEELFCFEASPSEFLFSSDKKTDDSDAKASWDHQTQNIAEEPQFLTLQFKMLVVDDDEDVHRITHLVLDDFCFNHKSLSLSDAYSAHEACELLKMHDDFALVLLDVVMESHDAGFNVVKYIRETLNNPFIRIILRTGQPGDAPEEDVIILYDINDYRTKTELTATKIKTVVMTSIRTYEAMMSVELLRRDLSKQVQERTQKLQKTLAEQRQDLLIAGDLQKYIFASRNLNHFNIKIAIRYLPLSHVSGDIYYISENQTGNFNFFVGDATGHGVTAALSAIMANIALDEISKEYGLCEAMIHLNGMFIKYLPDDRFMTAIYGTVSKEGLLQLVNAGQTPALLLPAGNDEIITFDATNPPLGLFKDAFNEIKIQTYQLQQGDKVFVYTDGVTEALNLQQKEEYGKSKLYALLQKNREKDLEITLSLLLDDVKAFVNSDYFGDDVSIIAFEYNNPQNSKDS
ncbi:fused response regulator/phosphatase [Deltaproteobacteria bacterium TL4]